MAVRTAAMPILDRDGLFCCGPIRWIAILNEYEYEYRLSARADSLSTSTRKRTNKASDRSARSGVLELRRINYPEGLTDQVSFARAGTMHNFSYLGGLIGIVTGITYLVIQRRHANKASDATSKPAPGAGSSAHQG